MRLRLLLLGGAGLVLSGCATQGNVAQGERQLRAMIQEDRKQLQMIQRQVDRLQKSVEERGGRLGGPDRVAELEKRVAELEGRGGRAAPLPPVEDREPAEAPERSANTPTASTSTPTTTAPPTTLPPPPENDEWSREVGREAAAVGAMGSVPERTEYQTALDAVQRKDCGRAVGQLNSFAASHKDSPLAGNALYWAARCYQQKGETKQAISKFYEVGTRYPKNSRAPAALWAQGNLFLQMGNTGDARLVLSEIIRKYPNSDEAARARQKLTEIER